VRQGDLYTQLGRFDEAERAIHEALRIRRALGDAAGLSVVKITPIEMEIDPSMFR
jgi:hypothetical protein